jgi:Protein of unknown function (DUF2955)
MSANTFSPAPATRSDPDRGTQHATLRLAFGVTAAFTIAEALDWDFTFLGPVLAAQVLAKPGPAPTVGQALGLMIMFGVAAGTVLLLSSAFVTTPPVLVLALALVLYLSFFAQLRGAPDIVTMLFQISAVSIPVFAVITPELSAGLAQALVTASITALLTVWAAHAVFPEVSAISAPMDAGTQRRFLPVAAAAQAALHKTLVIMPVLILYLFDDSQVALVMLVVIVIVVRQYDPRGGLHAAVGLIVGNLIGGLAAVLAFNVIQAQDTLVFFVTVCLTASLIFAPRIIAGAWAPLYGVAFSTFLILLGIGMSPLPGASEGAFASRLFYVLLATAYCIGALSLFRSPQDRAA